MKKQEQIDASLPLERFQTRPGKEVIKVIDTGLDIPYPIVYIAEGTSLPVAVNKLGRYTDGEIGDLDLIQLPEPDVISHFYVNIYSDGKPGAPAHSRGTADANALGSGRNRIAVVEIITNVTKGTVKTKVHKV